MIKFYSRSYCWHDIVIYLSVCLSVTKCIMSLGVSVAGVELKLVPSCSGEGTSYSLLQTLLLYIKMYRSATTHSEKPPKFQRLE